MYTIVVCPKCEHVNTVKDVPKRTECKKCGKSHQFSNLRHYFQHEEREVAVQARAKIQAKLAGKEDAYERAFENGALREVDGGALNNDDLLEAAGVDADEVADAGRRALRGEGHSTSQTDVMLDAVRDDDANSVEGILRYAADHGIPEEKAVSILQKMKESPDTASELLGIDDPDGVLESGTAPTEPKEEEEPRKTRPARSGGSSQRQIMIDAIERQDDPDFDDVLEYAEERGVDREKAGQIVAKMREASEITMRADGTFRRL